MIRGLACLAVLIAAAAPLSAQESSGAPSAPPAPDGPGPTRLTVYPAPLPEPALKYQLLPELKDRSPGNAALLYQRAHSAEWWAAFNSQKEYLKVERWLELPLSELPRAQMRYLESMAPLREMDLAARRLYCDWEMVERVRTEGVALQLPDVQGFRLHANLLATRTRLEMANGDLNRAVYTLQTGFAMSRDVADAPILVNFLVGAAIANQLTDRLEEFIQLKGTPNLFWALTTLPQPLLNLRKPLQGERMFLDAEFPDLKTLATTVWTPQQQENFQVRLERLENLTGVGGSSSRTGRQLMLVALTLKLYPDAKRFLLAQGRPPAAVEALPALQAVLLYTLHNYQKIKDDMDKWVALPYWQASPGLEQASHDAMAARRRLEGMPFLDLLPAVEQVYRAHVRLDRRLAALRCIEAVRLYAATHDGKLPATLSDITAVPLPVDPVTGRSFDYAVSGARVTLRGSRGTDGRPALFPYPLHYEITFNR